MKKLSVTLSGHRTSVTLEDIFIKALRDIATAEKTTVSEIIARIDRTRGNDDVNLSSALRIWVLQYMQKKAE